jgi:hypothetical protein
MTNNQDNRVLARNGARQLTEQELKTVHGGFESGVCTFRAQVPHLDGDC